MTSDFLAHNKKKYDEILINVNKQGTFPLNLLIMDEHRRLLIRMRLI